MTENPDLEVQDVAVIGDSFLRHLREYEPEQTPKPVTEESRRLAMEMQGEGAVRAWRLSIDLIEKEDGWTTRAWWDVADDPELPPELILEATADEMIMLTPVLTHLLTSKIVGRHL